MKLVPPSVNWIKTPLSTRKPPHIFALKNLKKWRQKKNQQTCQQHEDDRVFRFRWPPAIEVWRPLFVIRWKRNTDELKVLPEVTTVKRQNEKSRKPHTRHTLAIELFFALENRAVIQMSWGGTQRGGVAMMSDPIVSNRQHPTSNWVEERNIWLSGQPLSVTPSAGTLELVRAF